MSGEGKRIIVADDDPGQRGVLEGFLAGKGYEVRAAADAEGALALFDVRPADLVLLDVRMPGMGGMAGLQRLRSRPAPPAVILLTAYAGVRDAVEAMRLGAADYLEKPVDLEELLAVVAEAIGDPGPEAAGLPPLPEGMVVAGAGMAKVVHDVALVAPTAATVLVTGESGTGKERIAELIHRLGLRKEGPFIRTNCAAIPSALVESELFGHRKGAFTGAEANRIGRFEAAKGGTILLDEVGELPLEVQPKLLRVLEDGSYERVGESESRKSDARVVACTNRDLEAAVAGGTFREDLFWRLDVFRIHLPPLRDRLEEIPQLARSILGRSGGRSRLSPAALRVLEDYRWPGNVRELSNVLERASILASGGIILPEHLPEAVLRGRTPAGSPDPGPDPSRPGGAMTVGEAERRAIREALRATGGNRTRAAQLLGISRRTLLYRLKGYGGEP